jgi:SAM-dependent methyltransferase
MEAHTKNIAEHYGRDNLADAIVAALEADGKDLSALTIDDLQMVDEVHSRGRETTLQVVSLTNFSPEHNVVDLGSGLGGPARYIATTFGCRVTGIDLTESFVAAANRLTELLGMTERVGFQTGSALETPYDDNSFDRAVTIQMQMGIADKERFYREVFRILKPGGVFVFQDIVAGPTEGPIHTPTPWASVPEQSFLYPPDALHKAIEDAGFETVIWRDSTPEMKAWQSRQNAAPRPEGPRPNVGIHLVFGSTAGEKRKNSQRNQNEDRIGYIQAAFRKP